MKTPLRWGTGRRPVSGVATLVSREPEGGRPHAVRWPASSAAGRCGGGSGEAARGRDPGFGVESRSRRPQPGLQWARAGWPPQAREARSPACSNRERHEDPWRSGGRSTSRNRAHPETTPGPCSLQSRRERHPRSMCSPRFRPAHARPARCTRRLHARAPAREAGAAVPAGGQGAGGWGAGSSEAEATRPAARNQLRAASHGVGTARDPVGSAGGAVDLNATPETRDKHPVTATGTWPTPPHSRARPRAPDPQPPALARSPSPAFARSLTARLRAQPWPPAVSKEFVANPAPWVTRSSAVERMRPPLPLSREDRSPRWIRGVAVLSLGRGVCGADPDAHSEERSGWHPALRVEHACAPGPWFWARGEPGEQPKGSTCSPIDRVSVANSQFGSC